MPLTGTEPAMMVARLNTARLGATRLGYYEPIPRMLINGVARDTNNVRIAGASVHDILNGTPNTATFRVWNMTPVKGQTIHFGIGGSEVGQLEFSGRILSTTQIYEADKPANVAFDLQCISNEWLLNRRKVTAKFTGASASDVFAAIIAGWTSGVSAAGVEPGLPTLDEITFTNEDVITCFDRICDRIGSDWVVGYEATPILHVPASSGVAHPITDGDVHTMSGLVFSVDLSQVRTEVLVEGGGSNTLAAIAVSQSTMPLADTSWYAVGGGTIVSGPQRITYTGKSLIDGTGSKVGGKAGLTPGTPSAAVVSGTAGNLSTGTYRHVVSFVINGGETEVGNNSNVTIAAVTAPGALSGAPVSETSGALTPGSYLYTVTYVTAAGETEAGTASSSVVVPSIAQPTAACTATGTTGGSMTPGFSYRYEVSYVDAAGSETNYSVNNFPNNNHVTLGGAENAVSLTSIPTSSDDRVVERRIYRHCNTVHDWKRVGTITNNTATTFTDNMSDVAAVGQPSPPTVPLEGVGTGRNSLTAIPTSGDGRVTARRIYRTLVNGSAYKFLTTISGNVTTTYTDNTADASLGVDAPTVNLSGGGQIDLTNIPIGPAGTTARKIYRSPVNIVSIPAYKLLTTIANNTATTYTDNISDVGLGAVLAPEVSTVGPSAGDTSMPTQDLAAHDSAGGWVLAGSQVIRYTGRSGSSGAGTLTGVPASGIGAITAALPYDTPLVNAPHLTGVSGVLYAINQGESVNLLVTRDDAGAQSAMAALVGGDGIHQEYIQDRRLSQAEAEDRGDAKLLEVKDPIVTVRYQTRDRTTRSGRDVTITLGAPTNISGTFKIQRVSVNNFSATGTYWPTRQVEASSRRFTFEQLLRLVKAA